MVDYSKWKNIEVSDDEDDTHPNIDTPSLFRWRHQARVERMEQMAEEKKDIEKQKRLLNKRKKDLDQRKKDGEDVKELEEEVSKQEKEVDNLDEELKTKERLTPWNVDTIGSEKFSKTVINPAKPKPKEDETDEQKAIRFKEYVLKNETLLKQYGMLKRYEDTRRFLLDNPHLACEDTGNYLVYWCIDLAMEDKIGLMNHISHQCIAMQFLLELAKQLDRDPRSCISPFFAKIAHVEETEYKDAFNKEVDAFRERIQRRAQEKNKAAEEKAAEEAEEERLARIAASPGGLDPLEVLESLPESLRECFESQNIPKLQEAISAMEEKDAAYHMRRCVDSGLWLPSGGMEKRGEASADAEDDEDEYVEAEEGTDRDGKEGAKKSEASK